MTWYSIFTLYLWLTAVTWVVCLYLAAVFTHASVLDDFDNWRLQGLLVQTTLRVPFMALHMLHDGEKLISIRNASGYTLNA
jgi:hypothetical protein